MSRAEQRTLLTTAFFYVGLTKLLAIVSIMRINYANCTQVYWHTGIQAVSILRPLLAGVDRSPQDVWCLGARASLSREMAMQRSSAGASQRSHRVGLLPRHLSRAYYHWQWQAKRHNIWSITSVASRRLSANKWSEPFEPPAQYPAQLL